MVVKGTIENVSCLLDSCITDIFKVRSATYSGEVKYKLFSKTPILDGKGVVNCENGDTIDATFSNNEMVQGIYRFENGSYICFALRENAKDPYGKKKLSFVKWGFKEVENEDKDIQRYKNGSEYSGTFKNGLRDGIGTCLYVKNVKRAQADKYIHYYGGWKNGMIHGVGIYSKKNLEYKVIISIDNNICAVAYDSEEEAKKQKQEAANKSEASTIKVERTKDRINQAIHPLGTIKSIFGFVAETIQDLYVTLCQEPSSFYGSSDESENKEYRKIYDEAVKAYKNDDFDEAIEKLDEVERILKSENIYDIGMEYKVSSSKSKYKYERNQYLQGKKYFEEGEFKMGQSNYIAYQYFQDAMEHGYNPDGRTEELMRKAYHDYEMED